MCLYRLLRINLIHYAYVKRRKPASNRICSVYEYVYVSVFVYKYILRCHAHLSLIHISIHWNSASHIYLFTIYFLISFLFCSFCLFHHLLFCCCYFFVFKKHENKPSCSMSFVVFSLSLALNFAFFEFYLYFTYTWYILFGLSPLLYASVNVFDDYIVSPHLCINSRALFV